MTENISNLNNPRINPRVNPEVDPEVVSDWLHMYINKLVFIDIFQFFLNH